MPRDHSEIFTSAFWVTIRTDIYYCIDFKCRTIISSALCGKVNFTGDVQGKPEEKPKTKKAGIVKRMFLDFGAVPFPALVLGIGGLIPFVALAPPLAQMLPLPVSFTNHYQFQLIA